MVHIPIQSTKPGSKKKSILVRGWRREGIGQNLKKMGRSRQYKDRKVFIKQKVYEPSANYVLSLFTGIWIETHFPLESLTITFFVEVFISLKTENSAVSSGKSFALEDKLSHKRYI